MTTRPAAQLLLVEAAAIEPILQGAADAEFDLPTACAGWSVRDVMAHCAAALTRTAAGELHGFTPEENQRDVDARRGQAIGQVLAELITGYDAAAAAIDQAGGKLDGIALGEWMHGGDIREALGYEDAYASAGVELALDLLMERSQLMSKPAVTIRLPDRTLRFGSGEPVGTLATDVATFVRICGGRRLDEADCALDGDFRLEDLVLFS